MLESLYLDNLELHNGNSPYFIVQPIEGLEFPSIRTSQFNKSGMDGIYVSNQFQGERRITLTGYVRGDNYIELRKALEAVCVPKKTNDVLNRKTLYFTLDGTEYRIGVQVLGLRMNLDNVDFGKFVIDLIAIDSAIYCNEEKVTVINPSQPGGFVYPVVYPIIFEEGGNGSKILNNEGNTIAYPIIRLAGTLTNPRIENRTTGQHIALTYELASGQHIDIDMENRTIIQGGVTNRIATKSSTSRFFGLQVGDNELVLTTSINGEGGSASVRFRNSFIGV